MASIPLPRFLPPLTGWDEPLRHPAIIDRAKAKRELAWEPKYTRLEALQITLHPN